MTACREDFSHAELCRFVQEAKEQRERADALVADFGRARDQIVAAQKREAEAYRLRQVAVDAVDALAAEGRDLREREARLVAAGELMAETLEELGGTGSWYINEDTGKETYIAGCHPRCRAKGISDRWREVLLAARPSAGAAGNAVEGRGE
jgi:hypothetical protein